MIESIDSLFSYIASGAVIPEPPIRILHVSDFHFGSLTFGRKARSLLSLHSHSEATWKALVTACRKHAPYDLLVASGDIATTGSPLSLRMGRERILELADHCSVARTNVFAVPGNHDRFYGYTWHAVKKMMASFEDVFSNEYTSRVLTVHDKRVGVFCFDSTLEGARFFPFANTGRVQRLQFDAFNNWLPRQGPLDTILAVLHHHPLPVPRTAVARLTVMKNGGTFMSHMSANHVHLVLHGHKHFPYSCRVGYGHHVNTVISGAGTATQEGGKEPNSFSRVELNPRRCVAVLIHTCSETGFQTSIESSRVYRDL